MKIVKKNQLKIVIFTAVKNRCMLHGHVFVMTSSSTSEAPVLKVVNEPCHRKQTFWYPTWSDTNQAVQLQEMARGLKFRN